MNDRIRAIMFCPIEYLKPFKLQSNTKINICEWVIGSIIIAYVDCSKLKFKKYSQ